MARCVLGSLTATHTRLTADSFLASVGVKSALSLHRDSVKQEGFRSAAYAHRSTVRGEHLMIYCPTQSLSAVTTNCKNTLELRQCYMWETTLSLELSKNDFFFKQRKEKENYGWS